MTSTRPSAIDVGRYLLRLASMEEEAEVFTPLRLQKLLYYVQGWSLGCNGEPMFDEKIEAWANGPVVREVWKQWNGNTPISPDDATCDNLTAEQAAFVASVWESYRAHSAWSLREMTHKELPWLDARKGYEPSARCDVEITQKAMREYFGSLAQEA